MMQFDFLNKNRDLGTDSDMDLNKVKISYNN